MLGDRIGQSGVEAAFDQVLRGDGRPRPSSASTRSAGRRASCSLTKIPKPGDYDTPHDRHRAPACRRARAPARHRARARRRRVGRERRLDRRARPEQRRHPRHGVLPDVPAERLHRPRRRETAEAAARRGDRQARELPGAQPRDRGDLSAGIDVQADHGARRASGAPRRPVLAAALHGLVRGARRHRRRPDVPQLGSERQPADGDVGGDRGLVRHVLLPPRDDVLRPAARAWAPAPGMGEPLRDRRLDRRRHRARGARDPAHAGVARGDVHERDRQALEARRLDPADDRPEGRRGHAAPDGAVLRARRERREGRDAARRLRGREDGRPERRADGRAVVPAPAARWTAASIRRRSR